MYWKKFGTSMAAQTHGVMTIPAMEKTAHMASHENGSYFFMPRP